MDTKNLNKTIVYNRLMINASALAGDLERAGNYANELAEMLSSEPIEEVLLANHNALKSRREALSQSASEVVTRSALPEQLDFKHILEEY